MKANHNYNKILLMLLPFHPPLIPPLGMACLKSFLQPHGFEVKTVDANTVEDLRAYYSRYFDVLDEHIPRDKQANFHNIGNELLRNHMMACIHHRDEKEYEELVKTIIAKTFYCDVGAELVTQLNKILEEYYSGLKDYFLELLDKEKPDVLGLSVFKGTIPSSLFVFRLAKEKAPGIMTVMGGGVFADQLAYGSVELEFFVEKTPYIDKIIIGEGENLFLKLLQDQLPGSRKVYSLNDIQPHFVDVSSVKVPDFSGYDVGYYPYLANYTSRSCPFQCSFCGETLFWGKYRKKGAEQIIDELSELYGTYNRQLFLMCDSLLNPTIDKLSEGLIQHLEDVPVYWDGYLRIDKPVCDIETTMRWRRGGYYRARLGVESGSPRILKMMDKKITIQQIKAGVSSLAYAGIKTTTYWIVGYPGETEEDFQQTLDLIEEMADDIYEAEANPFWYYLNALVKSDDWAKNCVLLYPEKAKDMLILQTRALTLDPSPEERYRRLNRFVQHCERLGIPNPYSLSDIYRADQRWKRLHKHAVPPLNDFYNMKIDKCREIPPSTAVSFDDIPGARLPGDYENGEASDPQPVQPSKILQYNIGADLTGKLHDAEAGGDTSPVVKMLAALNAWIAVISNQQTVTVGTIFASAGRPGWQKIRPIHLDLTGNPDCGQILARTGQVTAEAPGSRDYSPDLAAHGCPIVFIGYETFDWKGESLKTSFTPLSQLIDGKRDLESTCIDCDYTLRQDMLIEMFPENNGVKLFIRYNHRRYRWETVKRYFDRFPPILDAFLSSPDLRLSQLQSQDLEAEELDEIF